jgi:putative hemolysin
MQTSTLIEPEFKTQTLACEGKIMSNFQFENVEAGQLCIQLATTAQQLKQAWALRYQIFFQEMHGTPSDDMKAQEQDIDAFDAICDHLLVIDRSNGDEKIVGTYRLLRDDMIGLNGRFYTQDEFDITNLLASGKRVMEVGRSCVDKDYRSRSTIQLLWTGIAQYMQHYGIDVVFGCASFNATDPEEIKAQLSYLHYNHLSPQGIRARALESRYVDMALTPQDSFSAKRIIASLPPLIKGYLRLGAGIGEGAVIDEMCHTIDVCIMLERQEMAKKYSNHYMQSS